MIVLRFVVLFLMACRVYGDINMHNPRGSNNRADETGRNRANDNRLFDSQNNGRGGHNVGPFPGSMYFYAGSQVRIQWANQHSCADQNNFCTIVIQYMCDENLRDGTTTNTAPVTCNADECDTNPKFGHHESLSYYQACFLRENNKGLFTADRTLKRNSATSTRQNNNGNRYGFECPEEKDYYPYFGHSPWKDIAVLTYDEKICEIVGEHSQNDHSRWICTFSDEEWDLLRGKNPKELPGEPVLYLDKEQCEQSSFTYDGRTYQPQWKEIPSHGIPAPECLVGAPWSRDNHQGNTIGGEFPEYNWTVPNDFTEGLCTLRIRYNISTNDFPPWETDHTDNSGVRCADGKLGPEKVWDYDFAGGSAEAKRRHYCWRGDPIVDVFNLGQTNKKFRLRLAIDTTQYGRTFQDRSHSFAIKERPAGIDDAVNIYNLNVRGKRGNLQQVYPGTEYDFVPNILKTTTDDYIHIQWTGSDRNPNANAGQGRAKTDRSNIVQLSLRPYDEGNLGSNLTLGTNYPRPLCDFDLFGATREELTKLALGGSFEIGDTPGETLDNADAYFDFGLLQAHKPGKHYFFSTRNNAFTNRDQKASVIVE